MWGGPFHGPCQAGAEQPAITALWTRLQSGRAHLLMQVGVVDVSLDRQTERQTHIRMLAVFSCELGQVGPVLSLRSNRKLPGKRCGLDKVEVTSVYRISLTILANSIHTHTQPSVCSMESHCNALPCLLYCMCLIEHPFHEFCFYFS